ncbi:MAG TPA: Sec-independent protein translocase protein TatB [Polyangiaceae bacterium]|nr:Sec-independent protein translocase protein TatB [Polyangiaceae bacterium]HOG99639.1 Sec-independent protein translocase protein TatB [Polyangiaceae bacterium]HOR35346.1 Sec-independent protein translocase protein TatB [Polyangiaceae bacterium]HPB96425.1 Sec-independent protein translocase protein TatB [Polyangiaceae bacterium]HPY20151.1 Sec-independent protein translocase protein TatB [Polyangiaceae bacterium]
MLGLSFTEIVVVLLVAVVVIGPRQLPVMLRTAGRWIAKLRRMAFDMRTQSGIDDILRKEGLDKDLRQLQALMRRGNVLDALAIDVDAEIAREKPSKTDSERLPLREPDDLDMRDREYPVAGVDAYGLGMDDLDPYRMLDEKRGLDEAEPAGPQSLDSSKDSSHDSFSDDNIDVKRADSDQAKA